MKMRGRQKNKLKTRKELRKEKRQQKKLNRFHYHNEKNGKKIKEKDVKRSGKKKAHDEDEIVDSEVEDFEDEEIPSSEDDEEIAKEAKDLTKQSSESQLQRFQNREKKEQQDYFNEIRKSRVDQLKQANEEEDKLISKYEKLLKLNKRKKKDGGLSKFNDGLDYLLELCTDDSIQKMYKAAKEAADESDDEPLKKKPKKSSKVIQKDDSENEESEKEEIIKKSEKLRSIEKKYLADDDDFFNNFDIDSCDGSDSELEGRDNDEAHESKDEEESLIEEEQDDEEDELENNFDASDSENESGSLPENSIGSNSSSEDEECEKIHEDIYGRKRDKHGNLVQEDTTKYVPPHLRKALKSIDAELDPKRKEKLQNLKRQINGYINRLAEANLHRISIDIENIYSTNSRNDTNTVLAEVILNSLVSNVLSRERLVLEHTLLIAVLHANLGSEIGAFFLEILIEKFDKMCKSIDTLDVENKELDNIIFVICHLYTYRLFKHNIIFEMLNRLCEQLSEKRIECILLALKSVGFILRRDDPIALKEFILKAQRLLSTKDDDEDKSSRVTYMLDVLMAIKNNNMTKIPQYDASLVEHFRKLLKQFVRAGKYVTTLALTMDDLLKADERGKWWLVGSAWAGNDASASNKQALSSSSAATTVDEEQRNKIFALAKKQRMNTDAKRNVFYVLMTAEDYLDAFEKILSVTNDERTIIAVILHCCLSERDYNAYYSVLAQKFCEHNRKYMLSIQFAVWDRIKDIQSLTMKQINNLSRFLIYLIENGNIPLSVLKVVEFAEIEKTTLRFVRQVMLGLLLSKEENFHGIFEKIAPSFKLNSFKDQLRLFLKVFLLKDESKMNISDEQMQLLKTRLHLAEKFLSVKQF